MDYLKEILLFLFLGERNGILKNERFTTIASGHPQTCKPLAYFTPIYDLVLKSFLRPDATTGENDHLDHLAWK